MAMYSAPRIYSLPEKSTLSSHMSFRRELRKVMRETTKPILILDLSSRAILNAEELDLLLCCAQDAADSDATVMVALGSPENRVLFDLTRLSSVLPAFGSVKEAFEHLELSRPELCLDQRYSAPGNQTSSAAPAGTGPLKESDRTI